MRNQPHLVRVDYDADGAIDMLVVHLGATCEEGCMVAIEMEAVGTGMVDGLESGLYWFRAWIRINVRTEGDEFITEYEAVPIPEVPEWVTANLE